jgi:hypothetical protein
MRGGLAACAAGCVVITNEDSIMPFDAMSGGNPGDPWCRACRYPITQGQPAAHVHFQNDPEGTQGLTGPYHQACSKPFRSLAWVLNLNPWSGR